MKSAKRVVGQDRRGFTLVELMVVVVIIGILAAISIPPIKAYREKAQIAVALSTGEQIRNGIAAYEAANPILGYQGDIQSMSDVLGILQAAQVPLSSKSLSAILGGLQASMVPATIRCYFCVRDTVTGVMVCTEVPCPVNCLAGDFQIDIPLMGIERTEDQRLYLRIHSIEGVAVGRLSDLD